MGVLRPPGPSLPFLYTSRTGSGMDAGWRKTPLSLLHRCGGLGSSMESSEEQDRIRLSAECFNLTWDLLVKTDRSKEEDTKMVRLALESLEHWGQRADVTDRNRSIGHWLVSRACAVAAPACRGLGTRIASPGIRQGGHALLPWLRARGPGPCRERLKTTAGDGGAFEGSPGSRVPGAGCGAAAHVAGRS